MPPAPQVSNSDAVASSLSPRLTVAICTRNRSRLLERALHSVLPQVGSRDEILVVDNGSTDDTPAMLARLATIAPGLVICHEAEPGLSAARNTALRRARGEFVIFLDDDAVTETGWLEAYASFSSTPPSERAAVAGGPVIPDYESPPPKWLDPRRDTLDWGDTSKRVPARGGAWGCNLAYRRSAALQVGMFRTRLGREGRALGAHEETELNLRLEQAGYEVWWLPGARIRHRIAAERLRLRWRLESAFAAGRSRAVVRLCGLPHGVWRYAWVTARLLAVPFQVAFEIVAAPLVAFHRRGQTAAKALLHAADTVGLGWGLLTELCHRRTRS